MTPQKNCHVCMARISQNDKINSEKAKGPLVQEKFNKQAQSLELGSNESCQQVLDPYAQ